VKDTLEIGGWLPYWRATLSTEDVLPNLGVLTTVHPFAFSVGSDGALHDTLHSTEEPWVSFIAEAKAKKVRVIPTIMWADGEAIHRILSSKETRTKLVIDIVALVQSSGWDGIDLDFESKYAETRIHFSAFLRELYPAMGNKWVYCTIESRTPLSARYDTVPANIEYANDYVEINKYCDRVQIMAYDQGTIDLRLNRATIGPYAPIADVRWVEKVMGEAMKTIAPRKLVIGIPTYGYEYQVAPLSGGGFSYDRMWAFNQRYGFDIAAQLGTTPIRNAGGELQLLYLPERLEKDATALNDASLANLGLPATALSNAATAPAVRPVFNIMSWGDATSVVQKIALAKRLGLRGVAIFKLDGGEDLRIWDILAGK
ncbi:MAG: glycosyl hydrolase family 18 protein, partial [Candidatus Adlerbacteria bacterium]|nr:glycosyl hydrolase family 18 protein [Candidatus Adlerbacteria bacterium]